MDKRVLLAVAMVAFCASVVHAQEPAVDIPPVQQPSTPPPKTVGIIVATGSLHLKYVGTTAFSNKESMGDIADWNLDTEVIADMREALGSQYDVKPLQYQVADFDAGFSGSLFSGNVSKIADAVHNHVTPGAECCDIYLVMVPAGRMDDIAGTNQQLFGTGVYKRGFLGMERVAVYTSLSLTVVDGHSFKPIDQDLLRTRSVTGGEALGRMLFGGMAQTTSLHPYFDTVGDSFWADDFSRLTEDQKTLIQTVLKKLLKEEVPATLRDLKVIP